MSESLDDVSGRELPDDTGNIERTLLREAMAEVQGVAHVAEKVAKGDRRWQGYPEKLRKLAARIGMALGPEAN